MGTKSSSYKLFPTRPPEGNGRRRQLAGQVQGHQGVVKIQGEDTQYERSVQALPHARATRLGIHRIESVLLDFLKLAKMSGTRSQVLVCLVQFAVIIGVI